MKKTIAKRLVILAVVMLVITPVFALGLNVNAQNANNMLWGGYESNVQVATGLGNKDPRDIAGSVVNIILGFLGIIAVSLIMYAGWLYMTSDGEETQINKAKDIFPS